MPASNGRRLANTFACGAVPLSKELRIGHDLMAVDEVRDSVARFGDRYLRRVYRPAELAYCQTSVAEFEMRLAARFAAKEAAIKVLRPNGEWPPWDEIEVVRHSSGWCSIALHGSAAVLAERENVTILSCSMSHSGSYASAVVLAQSALPSGEC